MRPFGGWSESGATRVDSSGCRHNHTEYDKLLASGVDRADARERIAVDVEEILAAWRK